jgi:acetyl-CoA synthetase
MPGTDPSFAVLRKPAAEAAAANLADYERERARFSWEAARAALHVPGKPFNIAGIVLDRHVEAGRGGQVAARFVERDWRRRDVSYSELQRLSSRFATLLQTLDPAGDGRVFSLLGRCPQLHVTALGTLRAGRVFCPLFTAFGPEPIQTRLTLGAARVLVTTSSLYARKVAALRPLLPALQHVILVTDGTPAPQGTLAWHEALAGDGGVCTPASTTADSPALLHFTSGTTGQPKGVVLPHDTVVAHHATARYALDLRDQDRIWCTADPGWVTGLAYGVLAPLACGATSIVDTEEFDPRRWYRLLAEERVTVWYTAPTAVRMLMKAGTGLARETALPELRFLASVGEPLNPEAVTWGVEAFGRPFHDNWWQTETGAIMVANYAAEPVKPGSMGRPVPGVDAAILLRTGEGGVEPVESPDAVGELALRAGWPSMFRGYLGQEAKYRACFVDGWYLTGDLARRDADGYYWFVGRKDDVIKSAGHLISPFEVESALLAHPAVAQAGVIGLPDAVAHELVKAFVELKPGFDATEALRRDLLAHARRRLGAAVAPRDVAFVASLPRTRSGKIMRRVLKARELGLPEGDLSTLEGAA